MGWNKATLSGAETCEEKRNTSPQYNNERVLTSCTGHADLRASRYAQGRCATGPILIGVLILFELSRSLFKVG